MYVNVLMLYCRRTRGYSPQQAARLLGISPAEYLDFERGNVLLTLAQARQLGRLYNSKPDLFQQAAQQLDLLMSSRAIIKILTADNDRLRASLRELDSRHGPENE